MYVFTVKYKRVPKISFSSMVNVYCVLFTVCQQNIIFILFLLQILMSISSFFLLTSVFFLILSTVPEFQVNVFKKIEMIKIQITISQRFCIKNLLIFKYNNQVHESESHSFVKYDNFIICIFVGIFPSLHLYYIWRNLCG